MKTRIIGNEVWLEEQGRTETTEGIYLIKKSEFEKIQEHPEFEMIKNSVFEEINGLYADDDEHYLWDKDGNDISMSVQCPWWAKKSSTEYLKYKVAKIGYKKENLRHDGEEYDGYAAVFRRRSPERGVYHFYLKKDGTTQNICSAYIHRTHKYDVFYQI